MLHQSMSATSATTAPEVMMPSCSVVSLSNSSLITFNLYCISVIMGSCSQSLSYLSCTTISVMSALFIASSVKEAMSCLSLSRSTWCYRLVHLSSMRRLVSFLSLFPRRCPCLHKYPPIFTPPPHRRQAGGEGSCCPSWENRKLFSKIREYRMLQYKRSPVATSKFIHRIDC